MKNKYIKSEKGVTLMTLTVYIIVMLIIVGIVTTISTFFYGNLNIVRDSAKYACEFDKFNSSFLSDVKSNKHANVDSSNKTIIFEDGSTYKYNESDEGIYKGKSKVSSHVKFFSISKKTIVVNNVDKEILSVNIVIGSPDKSLIHKQIDYTLKYW